MAGFTGIIKTLADLTAQTTAADTDVMPIGATSPKKITIANLKEALGINAINRNNENKIVVGSTKNAMILTTESSLAFDAGTATLNVSSIAAVYGKTVASAISHIKSAGGTVITSTNVASGVVTSRARSIETNAPYSGTLPCVIYLFLI